jgi:hypothetical protein
MTGSARQGLARRNSDFAKFWFGETVSLVGSNITVIAFPLVAVLTLQAAPQQLGLLRFLEFLPYLLLTLLLGVWVDGRRLRPVMMGVNAARSALIGVVPLLAVLGVLTMEILYAVGFAMGALAVLFDLCWMSYIPGLVARDDIVEANSKVAASYSAAEVAGPGAAGGLVQLLTAPIALAVDAASYVVSLISLMLIRAAEPPPGRPHGGRARPVRDLREGMRAVFGNRYLRPLAVQAATYNFFYQILQVVLILYIVRELGLGSGLLGLVLSVGAAGGVVGAVLARPLTGRVPFGLLMAGAMAASCVPALLVPAATGPTAALAATLIIALFVMQSGVAVVNVTSMSLRQTVTPRQLLARMNSCMLMTLYGTMPLGGLAGGVLAALLGPRSSLWVAGAGVLVSQIPILVSPIPRLRELPLPPAGPRDPVATGADLSSQPGR